MYKVWLTVAADVPVLSSHAVFRCITVVLNVGLAETIICFFHPTNRLLDFCRWDLTESCGRQ